MEDAQDAFDKARVRHEETTTQARGWSQRADVSILKNPEAIGKVMAMVVELEQKIARRATGEGGEAGDRCKKSFFPKPEYPSRDVQVTRPRTG